LSGVSADNTVDFLGSPSSASAGSTRLDDIGIVAPWRPRGGSSHLAFAIGFNRTNDWNSAVGFDAMNPSSSLIQYEAASTGDVANNIPYQLGLAGVVGGRIVSPISGGLQQTGTTRESGGLNALSIGLGGELAEGLSAGVSIHVLSGQYRYRRSITETDVSGRYNQRNDSSWSTSDLRSFTEKDDLTTDVAGVKATFGLLYAVAPMVRFGVAVTTPASITATENFSTTASATFDNGDQLGPYVSNGTNSYDVTTPWILSGGLSVDPLPGLTLAGSVDRMNFAELAFSNGIVSTGDLNDQVPTLLRSTLNYHLGAEYKIRPLGIGIRGGYSFMPSPYIGDDNSRGQRAIAGGLSVVLAHHAVLDFGFVSTGYHTFHYNYDPTSTTNERISATTFTGTFSYRW
jgi:hypothetical protein